jgi:4-hydroxy-4-methyl-2-oxoglutarate aldolase
MNLDSRIDPALTTAASGIRYTAATLAAAAALPTPTLHEAAGKIGVLPHAIKPVAPSFRLCGPALTVHSPPGDNLWLHRALYAANAGDIMVVYCGGKYDHGYWGEIMSTAAQVRGLGGLVIDGCVRDGALLETIGFPVFARGLCIRGTGKDFGARGFVNHPVQLGDLVIAPGDLIVGDSDGVVAIPSGKVPTVLAAAQQREIDEARILERLEAGETSLAIYGWQ